MFMCIELYGSEISQKHSKVTIKWIFKIILIIIIAFGEVKKNIFRKTLEMAIFS